MATVVTVGNSVPENSVYSQICEKLMRSIEDYENDRIFSTYLYFTIIAGILNKLGCHPSSIIIYTDYIRNTERAKTFENNLTYDYGIIYESIAEDNITIKKLLFSITFVKPFNYKPPLNNIKINNAEDEVLIDLRSYNEDNNFFMTYGDGSKKFYIKDYNNKEETDPLINSIIDDLLNIYGRKLNTFSKNYLSYRKIYSKEESS